MHNRRMSEREITLPKKPAATGRLAKVSKMANPTPAMRRAMVEAFDLHEAPGHLLRRCHSRARAVFEDLVGRHTGLSKQQVALLLSVAHNPANTHAQLSHETGFDRNTLADTLDRLIAKGLVVRNRSALDGRAYEIHLTEAGRKQLEDLIPLSVAVQEEIIRPIPKELRAQFIHCLQLLADSEVHSG